MTDTVIDVKTITLEAGSKHIIIIECPTREHLESINRDELQDALRYFMESSDDVIVLAITSDYKVRVEKVEEETVNEASDVLPEQSPIRD